jgi:uncharacterized protein
MPGPDIQQVSTKPLANRRAKRELFTFFGTVFALTWGLGALLIFARPQLESLIGPVGQVNKHWLYYLAVSAPTICAVFIAAVSGGWRGLMKRLFGPVPLKWWAVAILIYPAALIVNWLIQRALGGDEVNIHALTFTAPTMAVTTLVLLTDPGALGEELGWRGFALPRLLQLFGAATSAIVLGVIWTIWHAPAFLVDGLSQAAFNFGWFLLALVSLSILMTWIFVHANGNAIVGGVVPHMIFNLAFDAHVFKTVPKTEAIVLAAIAVILLCVFGATLQGRRKRSTSAAPVAGPIARSASPS